MKKLIYLILIAFLGMMAVPMTSCSRKSGCQMNEQATSKPNKKGKYAKAKSGLFDKKTQKRMAKK